jgi:hypothetical protein
LFLYRRGRRRQANDQPDTFEKSELADNPILLYKKDITEIGGDERKEMDSVEIMEMDELGVLEMPTIHNEPVELDANKRTGPRDASLESNYGNPP